MEKVTFGIHWLALTIHTHRDQAFNIYEVLFKDRFGEMVEMGHGGRGFKEIWHSLMEFKIYLNPIQEEREYFHYEIPGQACELISWDYFHALGIILESNYKDAYKFTRLDFAFDNLGFSPEQADQEIRNNNIRTLAKRENLEIYESPFLKRDNGEIGTYTVALGLREADRRIRIYNKRGYTRLELETRDDRAQLIAKDLLLAENVSDWFSISIGHLRDYIDFKTEWWQEFIAGEARAWATLGDARELTVTRMVNWLDRQVMPALSVAIDILPPDVIEKLINRGRNRRGAKYENLLKNKGK